MRRAFENRGIKYWGMVEGIHWYGDWTWTRVKREERMWFAADGPDVSFPNIFIAERFTPKPRNKYHSDFVGWRLVEDGK